MVIHRDLDVVVGARRWSSPRRYGGADLEPEPRGALRTQAAKRVALEFVERDRVTWDHRKLGGAY